MAYSPAKRRKLDYQHCSTAIHRPGSFRANGRIGNRNVTTLQEKTSRASNSSSGGSAGQWFERVNTHVSRSKQTAYRVVEDEAPFYMSNQVQRSPQPTLAIHERLYGVAATFANSENEDFRGVIDDLTVENKRLKRMLHREKNRHDASQEDRVLEVRMRGLRPDKKRELEHFLKNFAMNMNQPGGLSSSSTPTSGMHQSNVSLNSMTAAAAAAAAKGLQTDSGYASNSGRASAALSNTPRSALAVPSLIKHHHIKSYLHDMPDHLRPKESLLMSEKSKMALVVRRLEQLFAGKNASPGEHSQPLQQQAGSHLAARADRREDAAMHKKRKAEGSREAHILPHDSDFNIEADWSPPEKSLVGKSKAEIPDSSGEDGGTPGISRSSSPDQRPTRPLDLDVQRAQVAEDNVEYIRHLGLSSPRLDTDDASKEEPWMYLNLLTNMAQLHTINVTPEFIRKSILKLSSKFELSQDGHRVRWKGGNTCTVFSTETEKAMESPEMAASAEMVTDPGLRGRSNYTHASATPSDTKTGSRGSEGSRFQASTPASSNLLSSVPLQPSKPRTSFDYKPIIFKGTLSDLHAESYLNDSSDSFDDQSGSVSQNLSHALSKANLNRKDADEGVLTFYNSPYFCSDRSGDKAPLNMKAPPPFPPLGMLGVESVHDYGESALRYHDACYFAPQFAKKGFNVADDCVIPDLDLAPIIAAGECEPSPLELEVSGLGGVIPADNFALDVQVARAAQKPQPCGIERTVTGVVPQCHYNYLTFQCTRLDLQASLLPPPSYIFFTSNSSDSGPDMMDDSDTSDGSDETSSAAADDYPAPPTFLRYFSTDSSHERSSSDDASPMGDDSSSVDFLEAARAADPHAVAAQERAYLLHQPGGAMTIAASLAATVGTVSESSSDNEDENEDMPSDPDDVGSELELDEEYNDRHAF